MPSGYSQQAYNQALKQMPPYLSEYSDCADLIHKAQLASARTGGGTGGPGEAGGSGSAAPVAAPSPAEQHSLENVPRSGSTAVRVGGEAIHPGVVHVDIASAFSTLPTPLFALLAFLLVCSLLALGRTIRNHVRARRHTS